MDKRDVDVLEFAEDTDARPGNLTAALARLLIDLSEEEDSDPQKAAA